MARPGSSNPRPVKPAPLKAGPSLATGRSGLRTVKVSEMVVRALLDHILAEDLQAGDPLPNERDMVEWLGVARSSIREALRLLEAQGVIAIRTGPNGGPTVREPTADMFAATTTLLLRFMRTTFGEVIDARIDLDPHIISTAALRRTDDQLRALQHSADEMTALAPDPNRFQAPYDRFHHVLGEATGNRVLLTNSVALHKMWSEVDAEVLYSVKRRLATAESHQRMLGALRDRDATAAEEISRHYLVEYKAWVSRRHPGLLARTVEWSSAT